MFWKRKPLREPLLGAALEMGDLSIAIQGVDGEVTPFSLSIQSYLAVCDEAAKKVEGIRGHRVWAVSPFQGLPWMEAICGSTVFCSGASLWADTPEGEIEEHLASWETSSWFSLLKDSTAALADHAGARYP